MLLFCSIFCDLKLQDQQYYYISQVPSGKSLKKEPKKVTYNPP